MTIKKKIKSHKETKRENSEIFMKMKEQNLRKRSEGEERRTLIQWWKKTMNEENNNNIIRNSILLFSKQPNRGQKE